MKPLAIYAINPKTKALWLMPARDHEEARRIENMASREGHLHIEVIDSRDGLMVWLRVAKDLLRGIQADSLA